MARAFKQGTFGESFRREPIGSTMQLFLEAFPEIEQVKNYVSDKVAVLTSDPSATDEASPETEAQQAAASWEVRKFCEKYSSTSINPTATELEDMSQRCASFPPTAVTSGIYDQLASWGFSGDLDWQPRLRALVLLEHLLGQPGAVGSAAHASVNDLQQLLSFLSLEVPQCKTVAHRLMKGPGGRHVVDIDDAGVDLMSYSAAPSQSSAAPSQSSPAPSQSSPAPSQSSPAHVRIQQANAGKPDCPVETASLPSTDDEQFDPDYTPMSEEELDWQQLELRQADLRKKVLPSACDADVADEKASGLLTGLPHPSARPGKAKATTSCEARPYLWLSSVETVAMEKRQDPFANLMSTAQPL